MTPRRHAKDQTMKKIISGNKASLTLGYDPATPTLTVVKFESDGDEWSDPIKVDMTLADGAELEWQSDADESTLLLRFMTLSNLGFNSSVYVENPQSELSLITTNSPHEYLDHWHETPTNAPTKQVFTLVTPITGGLRGPIKVIVLPRRKTGTDAHIRPIQPPGHQSMPLRDRPPRQGR
jgi:hypothetical protein